MADDENLKPALVIFGVMLLTAGAALIVKHRVRGGDAPVDRMAEAVVRFEQLTDEMCACRDQRCAQAVSERMTAWSQQVAKDQPKQEQPDKKTMERMTKVAERMANCMQKAMSPPEAN